MESIALLIVENHVDYTNMHLELENSIWILNISLRLFHFYFIVYALDGPTKHMDRCHSLGGFRIKKNLKEMTQFPPPTRNPWNECSDRPLIQTNTLYLTCPGLYTVIHYHHRSIHRSIGIGATNIRMWEWGGSKVVPIQ